MHLCFKREHLDLRVYFQGLTFTCLVSWFGLQNKTYFYVWIFCVLWYWIIGFVVCVPCYLFKHLFFNKIWLFCSYQVPPLLSINRCKTIFLGIINFLNLFGMITLALWRLNWSQRFSCKPKYSQSWLAWDLCCYHPVIKQLPVLIVMV